MVTRELGGLATTPLIPQIIISRDLGTVYVTPPIRPWFRPANVILRQLTTTTTTAKMILNICGNCG